MCFCCCFTGPAAAIGIRLAPKRTTSQMRRSRTFVPGAPLSSPNSEAFQRFLFLILMSAAAIPARAAARSTARTDRASECSPVFGSAPVPTLSERPVPVCSGYSAGTSSGTVLSAVEAPLCGVLPELPEPLPEPPELLPEPPEVPPPASSRPGRGGAGGTSGFSGWSLSGSV